MSTTSGPGDPLTQAALFARRAPSLHNSQPWHWHVGTQTLELRLAADRVLRATDPYARLAVLSCGAALHHAYLHLAAAGQHVEITRVPEPADPDLLARVRLDARQPADHDADRLVRAADRRRTDRRQDPGAPLDLHRVRSIRQAVRARGADLTVLQPRQVFVLAEAAELAHDVEAADPAWQVEVAGWIGDDRSPGTGIPTWALPADPHLVTAPARALRRAGSALLTATHPRVAVFAVLHSTGDGPPDWLTAGEALSAGWLTATALDVAVLPLSVVTEVAGSRDRIRALVDWVGHPHLVLRMAAGAPDESTPATPRLPAQTVISHAGNGGQTRSTGETGPSGPDAPPDAAGR